MLASSLFMLDLERGQAFTLAQTEAKASFERDLVFREWVAQRRGVYVDATITPPNPYLSHIPERDISTPQGRSLTLVDPAYMTREVHELAAKRLGTLEHITSPRPLRPENAADAWELEAFAAIEKGATSYATLETREGGRVARVLFPLMMEEACTACHHEPHDVVGTLRGGISYNVPMAPFDRDVVESMWRLGALQALLWALGMLGLAFAHRTIARGASALEQANERLIGEEARLKSVLDDMPVLLQAYNADGHLVMWNRASERATGLRAQDVLHTQGLPLPMRDDTTPTTAIALGTLAEADFADRELSHETVSGRRVVSWSSVSKAAPIGGWHSWFVGLDVTLRRRAEDALRRSESQLVQVQQLAKLGIWEWNPTTDEAACSDEFLEQLGLDKDSYGGEGAQLLAMIHPDDRASFIDRRRRRREGSRATADAAPFTLRVVTPDGETRFLVAAIASRQDADGVCTELGASIDISTLVHAQQDRAQLFQHSIDLLGVLDFEGHVRESNPAWNDHLVAAHTPAQCRWSDLVSAADKPAIEGALDALRGGAPVTNLVIRYLARTGEERTVAWNAFPVRDDKLIFVVGRDVTERLAESNRRELLERELNHARKLEAVGTLAGGIAHDFNNILGAIQGYVELLSLELPPESEAFGYTLHIARATKRAAAVTRHVLTLSRQQEPQREVIELASLAQEALELMRATLPSTVDIEVEAQEGLLVSGDPTQLHQVFINLATNAAHAMEQRGGTLKLTVAPTTLSDAQAQAHPHLVPGAHVCITVSDEGAGMSEEVAARIFDPFYTTKPTGRGTGLGLAIVHSIVRNHDGAVRVESVEGAGTTVTILLPRCAAAVTREPPVVEGAARGSARVLLVDDEPDLVAIGKITLESLGYVVTGFTSSREALEFFCADPERFDVVITDLTMPELTGEQLAAQLHDLSPQLPVIICTGFADGLSRHHEGDARPLHLLLKPVGRSELALAVSDALSRRSSVNSRRPSRADST